MVSCAGGARLECLLWAFDTCVVLLKCGERVVARAVGQYSMISGIGTHVNNCKLPLFGFIRLVLRTLGYRAKVNKEEGEEMKERKEREHEGG